jgi:hypothetical protein
LVKAGARKWAYVRFGSSADIGDARYHVRLSPTTGLAALIRPTLVETLSPALRLGFAN